MNNQVILLLVIFVAIMFVP